MQLPAKKEKVSRGSCNTCVVCLVRTKGTGGSGCPPGAHTQAEGENTCAQTPRPGKRHAVPWLPAPEDGKSKVTGAEDAGRVWGRQAP